MKTTRILAALCALVLLALVFASCNNSKTETSGDGAAEVKVTTEKVSYHDDALNGTWIEEESTSRSSYYGNEKAVIVFFANGSALGGYYYFGGYYGNRFSEETKYVDYVLQDNSLYLFKSNGSIDACTYELSGDTLKMDGRVLKKSETPYYQLGKKDGGNVSQTSETLEAKTAEAETRAAETASATRPAESSSWAATSETYEIPTPAGEETPPAESSDY